MLFSSPKKFCVQTMTLLTYFLKILKIYWICNPWIVKTKEFPIANHCTWKLNKGR